MKLQTKLQTRLQSQTQAGRRRHCESMLNNTTASPSRRRRRQMQKKKLASAEERVETETQVMEMVSTNHVQVAKFLSKIKSTHPKLADEISACYTSIANNYKSRSCHTMHFDELKMLITGFLAESRRGCCTELVRIIAGYMRMQPVFPQICVIKGSYCNKNSLYNSLEIVDLNTRRSTNFTVFDALQDESILKDRLRCGDETGTTRLP